MITYGQLWGADPLAWRRTAAAWQQAARPVGRRASEISNTAAALRSSWSGAAGEAAHTRLDSLRSGLAVGLPAFVEIDQILAEHAARLAQAKAMLNAAVTLAAESGVIIDRHGGTALGQAGVGVRAEAARREVTARIAAALHLAADSDRDAAHRLSDLAAAATAGWPTEPPPSPPPVCTDPVVVRQWWAGLTSAQRRWLVRYAPELIGRLDGVPVDARDQANRLLLETARRELLHRRQELLTEVGMEAELARVKGALVGLAAIEDRLLADTGPRAYLLGLDPTGDGKVIVAIGNPDQADNVLTYVPGMTSDLANAGRELARAYRVAQRCAELGPTEQTAAVLWLDYDAPDFVHEAFRASYAEAAAPVLHRFQEGLRATHTGPPAHQTVLGHSYGSLVVGTAARDYGLAADNLVFVGSPGVGVDHAADLGIPADRVWSTTARNDVIQYAIPLDEALKQLVFSTVPALGVPAALDPYDELWFGRNPSDQDFGGRRFRSEARGHSGYWDRDNPSLDAMARITLGGQHQLAVG